MPYKLSAREVLLYLNELGYNNINAQQLKEFMQDLKKLIKYDLRKKHEDKTTSSVEESPFQPSCDSTRLKDPNQDIFANLHTQQTVESKAKIAPRKESVVCVQIKRPKVKKPHSHCVCKHKEIQEPSSTEPLSKTSTEPLSKTSTSTDKALVEKDTQAEGVPDVQKDVSKKDVEKKISKNLKKKEMKPTVSYIRRSIRVTHKSDPVALYHHYQAEWKKFPIPGEDNRANLRWAIREQMLGAPRPVIQWRP